MKDEKVLVLTKSKTMTPRGFFLSVIKDAYKYKTIKLQATYSNAEALAIVSFLFKTTGFVEAKEPYKARVKSYVCNKCTSFFDNRIEICTNCGGTCKDVTYMAKIILLERLNTLECHLQETLEEDNCIVDIIESDVRKHGLLEKHILKEW